MLFCAWLCVVLTVGCGPGDSISSKFKLLVRLLCALVIGVLLVILFIQPASPQTQNPIKSLVLERQARHFLSLIRENSSLSEDLQINNYVSDLAKEIAKNARMDSDPLHYFVVNDSSINAFAGPGATFFINTGIIELAETEGELASVITHELAHYKQKHLSRLFSDYQATQLPTLVAILAGIVVGGDTGIAAIAGAQAAQAEAMIDYTLVYEREADAVGLQILTASGYSPIHARNFMLALEQAIREQGVVQSNIHNTHPVTPERIASFEARVNRYKQTVDKPAPPDFHFVKARSRVLFNWEPTRTSKFFEDNLPVGSEIEQFATRYGLALSLARDSQIDSARKELDSLRVAEPDNLWFMLAAAEIELNENNPNSAIELLADSALSENADSAVVEFYTLALIRSGNIEEANRYIKKHLSLNSEQIKYYKLHGETATKSGEVLNGYLSESEYHFRLGELKLAFQQLKIAEQHGDDFYSTEIIREKKRVIEEEIAWRGKHNY